MRKSYGLGKGTAAWPLAQIWVLASVAAWPSPSEKPFPDRKSLPLLFRYLITGADAVLVADAARTCVCVVQP